MTTETHDPVNVWHVYAAGMWHAVEFQGYAPVTVWVGGRLVDTDYRHMALGCTDRVCATLDVERENALAL